jgi:hypothetical protein
MRRLLMRVFFVGLRLSFLPWAEAGPLKGPRSRWTGIPRYPEHQHLQQTLQNRKRTTNIFGFSNFETRTEGNIKQSKIFLDFLNTKSKIENKANQTRKLKRQAKRNNGNIFGLFVFWKVEIKQEQQRKRKRTMDIQSTDKI